MNGMPKEISLQDIQQLIDTETEEGLQLDYKASDSLGKSDGKKKEISKDVSAMANSAGGRIIYGIAEYQQDDKKHLPEKVDPIEVTEYPKEWLEQVISSNISPKITDLVITPVPIDSSSTLYVVEIPQSDRGHQAKDKRYYKRYNFESVSMEDYELKDILNRRKSPFFEIEFSSSVEREGENGSFFSYINMRLLNLSSVFANYVSVHVYLPSAVITPEYVIEIAKPDEIRVINDFECYRSVLTNKENVFNHTHDGGYPGYTRSDIVATYYEPVLPGLSMTRRISVDNRIHQESTKIPITYEIYVDNSEPTIGEVELVTRIEDSTENDSESNDS